jgi:PAS domain S-box-containing protein
MENKPRSIRESRYRTLFEHAPVAIWDEDFSSLKKFLQALIASGVQDIRDHLESNPDLIAEAIRRVRVRHVNRVAREFYGASSEEELILALPRLLDPTASRVFIDEITALAGGASTFTAELSTFTLSGERRLVQMQVAVLPDEEDTWSRVVVAFTDLTERRHLEQSLQRANHHLRRINSDLEHFAYSAAHDLREPLRSIALYAQLLQTPPPRNAGIDMETAIGYILQNAGRMQALIDDLLAFARTIDSDDPLQCPPCMPQSVLSEVTASITGAIKESGSKIVVEHDLPPVSVEAGHLRQLLQNLLVNAIKYRSPHRAPEIRVSAVCSGRQAVFCVADNGIGIAREYQERVFGIFDRLHGPSVEGNGIGLALCKKIVEKYEGRIWVESEVDAGCRFYFTVPLAT